MISGGRFSGFVPQTQNLIANRLLISIIQSVACASGDLTYLVRSKGSGHI